MDRHSVNFEETGIRYITLKPRLLKCTTSAMEKGTDENNDPRAEVPQIPNSASTRVRK
jgi:hypothetical protein